MQYENNNVQKYSNLSAQLGDYNEEMHGGDYVSQYKLLLKQSPRLEEKIAEIHKSLRSVMKIDHERVQTITLCEIFVLLFKSALASLLQLNTNLTRFRGVLIVHGLLLSRNPFSATLISELLV